MDLGWGSVLAAGIGAGGSLLGGMIGASGQAGTNAQQMAMFQQQMDFNRVEAQKNRDWQQQMSSTAYQRSMADMRAAGLNPILAAGGGGASTPGGGAGSIGGGPSLGNPGEYMGAGVSSAAGAAARKLELDQVQANTDLAKQTEVNKKAEEALTQQLNKKAAEDTAVSAATKHQIGLQHANTEADTLNKGIQGLILSHDANTAFQKSRIAKVEADQGEKWGAGVWGNLGGTAEKFVGRVVDGFRQGLSADNPVIQQRIHNRRGVNVHATPPGEGLVIDMDRR